jgi:hypothetical protein
MCRTNVFQKAKLSSDLYSQYFLYIQGGKLVERRLNQRKWKWIVHGSPKDHKLTSITPVVQDETNEKFLSLFFTTSSGSVFEYRILKQSGEWSRWYKFFRIYKRWGLSLFLFLCFLMIFLHGVSEGQLHNKDNLHMFFPFHTNVFQFTSLRLAHGTMENTSSGKPSENGIPWAVNK